MPVPVPTGMTLVVAVGLVVVTDRVGKAVVVVCVVACVKKSKKGSALATVRRTARERIRAGTSMVVTIGPLDKESAWAEDGILISKQRLGGLIKITPMD